MPETGVTIPAHASALGQVLLAYRPALKESIDSYVATAVLGDRAGPLGAVALAISALSP